MSSQTPCSDDPSGWSSRHRWDVTPAEARVIQESLRHEIVEQDRFSEIRYVAGIDIGFEAGGEVTRAAVVLLDLSDLTLIEERLAHRPTCFPYVPGLLSFREAPAALEALEQLNHTPDLLVCDGQGRAHPRRFGIACHLGLLTDLPSIGVAKSRLIGEFAEPAHRKGAWSPLCDGEEMIGAVLRSRVGVKPIFVSVGHRVSLTRAIELTLRLTPRYRLPETTRRADRLASNRKPRTK